MKILGIIPARSGSKGIPNKNIIKLRGNPLISYMIKASLESKFITRLVVSTDSENIAEIAKGYGVEIPFIRPKELALDHVSAIAVAQHALRYFENTSFQPDIVASLQPTSPLVSPKDIDRCLQLMIESNCDSCFTMKKIEEYHPTRMYGMDDNKVILKPYTSEAHLQRQDRDSLFKQSGAVIARRSRLLDKWKGEDLAFGKDRRGVVVPWYRAVDVNDPLGLIVVESIMKHYNWLEDEVKS